MEVLISTRRRGFRRSDEGQGLVEFALVLPLLLLLIIGVVEFARAWNVRQAITDATRLGTRTLVVDNGLGPTESEVVIADALANARIDASQCNITVNHVDQRGEYSWIQVECPYTFKFIAPLIVLAAGTNTINLTSTVTMRTE